MQVRLTWSLIFVLLGTVLLMFLLLAAVPFSSVTPFRSLTGPQISDDVEQELAIPGDLFPLKGIDVNQWIAEHKDDPGIVEFYSRFTSNHAIARVIIDESIEKKVPVHLAFSLAWRESAFDPAAVSAPNTYGTRDWGLFQLNDGVRKDWSREDFFNIDKNTQSALRYLNKCIEIMGSREMGIAAYNVGVTGVRTRGVPAKTVKYIQAILEYESLLDSSLNARFRGNDLEPL